MSELAPSKFSRFWDSTVARVLAVIGACGATVGSLVGLGIIGSNPDSSTQSSPIGVSIAQGCGLTNDVLRVSQAWGPDRQRFTLGKPAPFVTLNSITDNPIEGNEFFFAGAKDYKIKANGQFCGSVGVYDGELLIVRAYAENSAADNLETPAENTRLMFEPSSPGASLAQIKLTLTAANSQPRAIWSEVELHADHPFRVDPIPGSGKFYTNSSGPAGFPLADDLWAGGAQLGYAAADGLLRPGFQYAVIATALVRITFVN